MRTTTFMLLAIGGLLFANCSKKNEPATPINAEQFSKLHSDKENDGKRFSITGYPHIGHDVTKRNNKIPVSIYTEPLGEGERIGSIDLIYKNKNNGIFIPDEFTSEDIQIYDNEGNQLGYQDKITISFTMNLDTNRKPMAEREVTKVKDGKIVKEIEPAKYYGSGPGDIKIEKAIN